MDMKSANCCIFCTIFDWISLDWIISCAMGMKILDKPKQSLEVVGGAKSPYRLFGKGKLAESHCFVGKRKINKSMCL